MPSWLDLVVLPLALDPAVDCWLTGELFAEARAALGRWHLPPLAGASRGAQRLWAFKSQFAAGWLCRYCLTYQLGFLLILYCLVCGFPSAGRLASLPPLGLAVTRLAYYLRQTYEKLGV